MAHAPSSGVASFATVASVASYSSDCASSRLASARNRARASRSRATGGRRVVDRCGDSDKRRWVAYGSATRGKQTWHALLANGGPEAGESDGTWFGSTAAGEHWRSWRHVPTVRGALGSDDETTDKSALNLALDNPTGAL